MNIDLEVCPRFENYLFDWDYKYYVLLGAYGSGKSYSTGEKLLLKCLSEKRKALVIREVFETLRESCWDVLCEILTNWDLISYDARRTSNNRNKVLARTSPMSLSFPNGSRIIFKGMDKPVKLKSLNGVSIVWLEEAPEIKYAGFKELIGRIRHPSDTIHFILTFNAVDTSCWCYKRFFINIDDEGNKKVTLDPAVLYEHKTVALGNTYYHHSLPEDNYFLGKGYIDQLDELKDYDPDLWRVARLGEFGPNGTRVLPQFEIADHEEVIEAVRAIPKELRFTGFDFGFEVSYNAVIRCAVDPKNNYLYIYWEYYKNHMTDDKTADELIERGLQKIDEYIVADSAEPKSIQYYRNRGFKMRPAKKFAGSRLADTKKVKRFRKIICSNKCRNTIRELKDLVYKVLPNGDTVYDEFNIDPHTFSAIWYALDTYSFPSLKTHNTMRGNG